MDISSVIALRKACHDCPLVRAVFFNGNREEILHLLESGAEVNQAINALTWSKNGGGTTALIAAARLGRADLVDLLLEFKADTDRQEGYFSTGKTALMYAAEYGHYDIVISLLRASANPNLLHLEGYSALTLAIKANCEKVIVALINYELSDLNLISGGITGSIKEAPLYAFTRRGEMAIVKLLLDKGADPNIADAYGASLLELALWGFHSNSYYWKRNVAMVEMLLQRGANPNVLYSGCGHELLLNHAARLQDLVAIKLLLPYRAALLVLRLVPVPEPEEIHE